jgi:hypothetical protein
VGRQAGLRNASEWFRDYWLCDLNPTGINALKLLQSEYASSRRRVHVLQGDFNEKVYDILNSGPITERARHRTKGKPAVRHHGIDSLRRGRGEQQ